MKLIASLFIFFAFVSAAPAAQAKSGEDVTYGYEDVQHLYEKALLAIGDLDQGKQDREYAELSWDLAEYGVVDILRRMPPKVGNRVRRAIVISNLAKARARAGDCRAALSGSAVSLSGSLTEALERQPLDAVAKSALKNIVETYALCGALEKAEEAIASFDPGDGERGEYLVQAYSAVASALRSAGDPSGAERYFGRAKRLALANDDLKDRNSALGQLAEEQILAGHYDEALESLDAIEFDPEQDFSWRLEIVNERYEMLAYNLASQGKVDEAEAVLDLQSAEARRHPLWLAWLRLDFIETLERDTALARLAVLQGHLEREEGDTALTYLARAWASRGEEKRALAILDRLYDKHLAIYRRHRRGTGESFYSMVKLNEVLAAYVLIGRPQTALDKIASGPFKRSRLDELGGAWGCLAGYARLNDDDKLLAQVAPAPNEQTDDVWELKATVGCFVEMDAFAEAEQLIDSIPASDRLRFHARAVFYSVPRLYASLAREMMGISYFDVIFRRSDRHF